MSPSMSKAKCGALSPRDLGPCCGCAPNVRLGNTPRRGPPPMTAGLGREAAGSLCNTDGLRPPHAVGSTPFCFSPTAT